MQSAITGTQPSMGGGSGSTTATGGGTYYAPPPGTVSSAEDYAGAQNAYNRALIRFNQQRTGLLRQYGYAGTVDPTTGLVTNLHVDAGNAYGGLQQLLHQQNLEDQSAANAVQDRGIFGGLANQAESELAYGHHGQTSQLAQTLLGNLSDLNNQQLDAKDTLDQALWQLQHQATTDAIGSSDFNPADLGGTDGGGGSDTGGGGSSTTNPRAAKVARMVGTPAQVARASAAAMKRAGGKSTPAAALAARSAGLNALYGLGARKAPAKKAPAKSTYRGRH